MRGCKSDAMNWLLTLVKCLASILLIVTAGYEYKLVDDTYSEESPGHKRLRKTKWVICIVAASLGLVAIPLGDWGAFGAAKADKEYRISQSETQAVMLARIAGLKQRQDENSQVLMNLATNCPPNPALLSALAQAKEQHQAVDTGILDVDSMLLSLKDRRDLV